ncbi:hypothetical protein [Leptospira alstonii]|uniref:hypothetical protein n=1 Tax=Leptospira alstonii TaxID=28452 RepID=UPI00077462BD|nr:hypothetical protein [Leptospira alstonii]
MDFNGAEYFALTKYSDLVALEESIPEINRLIMERFYREKPDYANNPDSYNFDYYLIPGKSKILVIDFDDLQVTLNKIKFLCSHSEKFLIYWTKFQNEYLDQTFLVETPSGGKHYYFKYNFAMVTRKVKCMKPKTILAENSVALEQYRELFPVIESEEKTKKKKTPPVDPVAIDLLPKAVVRGAGNISYNMVKKGVIIKKREYKILKDIKLKELDDDIFNVFEYLFCINANEKLTDSKKVKEKKTRSHASSSLKMTDYSEVIAQESRIEELNLESDNKILKENSAKLYDLKMKLNATIKELNSLLTLKEDSEEKEGIELGLKLNIQSIKNEFELSKKEMIKNLYSSRPDTEYIFNSLRRYSTEESYSSRKQLLFPALLNNVDKMSRGHRSEKEMAFVVNLKIRNYEDPIIYYLLQKNFSKNMKSFESGSFLEQALMKAEVIKAYPEQLSLKGIWNEIILTYSLIRKINYEKVFGASGGKIRTLIETFYDNASIQNNFTINKSQSALSLGGISHVSNKTIKKYFLLLEKKKFFKEIEWVKGKGTGKKIRKLFPTEIVLKNVEELMEISWLKKNLLEYSRYTPQDANQSFASIKGVGVKGMEIIGYLRENGGVISKKELYKKFENIKNHRRVIYRHLKTLEDLKIISFKEEIKLLNTSLNKKYSEYATDYNAQLNEKKKVGKKILKRLDPVESRKQRYLDEKEYWNVVYELRKSKKSLSKKKY